MNVNIDHNRAGGHVPPAFFHLTPMYKSELREALVNTRVVSRYLRRSVERGMVGFSLHYQPQADRDGRVVGAEALLRWDPNCGHVVGPNVFVPLLERSRRIVPVGSWAFSRSVEQLSAFRAAGVALERISVNVSARQLSREFADFVSAETARAGLTPSDVTLELTEGQAVSDSGRFAETIRALSAEGYTWEIDDFGTGYASMRWLRKLSFARLKLDRSLLIGTGEPPGLLRGICDMAHAIEMRVTCEGVESQEQWDRALDAGVDYVQGFRVGRPVPAEEFSGCRRE